jgi:hypothetical protein
MRPALSSAFSASVLRWRGAEQREVYGSRKGFEVITEIAQPLQAVRDIEEAWLPAHLLPSVNLGSRSRNRLTGEGF